MANKKSKNERVNEMVEQSQKTYDALLDAVPDKTYNASVAIACGRLFARFIAAAASSQTSALAMVLDSIDLLTNEVKDWCDEFKKPLHTKMNHEES